jgi:membrane-bound lytic murein transglycosylase A
MHRLTLVIAILIISSCSSNYTYKARKSNLSGVLKNGSIIKYEKFDNWDNNYLEDLNFEIYVDQNGKKVAIQNKSKANKSKHKYLSHNLYSDSIEDLVSSIENKIKTDPVSLDIDNLAKSYEEKPSDILGDLKLSMTQDNEDVSPTKKPKMYNKTILNKNNMRLVVSSFEDLDRWKDDDVRDAMYSFSNSCDKFAKFPNKEVSSGTARFGLAGEWYEVCKKIPEYANGKEREFFEKYFTPVRISKSTLFRSDTYNGTFTGYYELDLRGSRDRDDKYRYPIYSLPRECRDKQCYTRNQIQNGALLGRGLEMYYSDSYTDIFFLQMQGSGLVKFEDGTFARLGFAGHNRRGSSSIFGYMKRYNIPKKNANLTEMLNWLEDNPEEGYRIFAKSDSYVFFRHLENNGDGAIGSHGVPLTPSRSVAVDPRYIPYGVPMWIDTTYPIKNVDGEYVKVGRLYVAQDTGSAIKGQIRGDIFFGHGTKAKYLARNMKFSGSQYMLIPNLILNK